MNLQQLEYIVALDHLKSFSKAAESCFITQATLSIMIKRLEDELNITLFDRKVTPIITTEAGLEIVEEARKIIYHANRIKQLPSELLGKVEGELKIGVIPTVAGNLLHRILPSLIKKYPRLELNIKELTTQYILEKIKTGQLDAGIISTPLKNEDLEEKVLYYEKLKVYGKNMKGKTKYLQPKDINDEKVWLMEAGNCITDQIINVCSLKNKTIESNLNFQPNSFDSLINMVDKLKGITLIPELYYLDLPSSKKKLVIDFIAPYPVREISLVYHRPYAKLRLIDAVTKEISNTIKPMLETTNLKNYEMKIAKMNL
jgi:LysR family hydrogen peroxide-inducible transcriptional activator